MSCQPVLIYVNIYINHNQYKSYIYMNIDMIRWIKQKGTNIPIFPLNQYKSYECGRIIFLFLCIKIKGINTLNNPVKSFSNYTVHILSKTPIKLPYMHHKLFNKSFQHFLRVIIKRLSYWH